MSFLTSGSFLRLKKMKWTTPSACFFALSVALLAAVGLAPNTGAVESSHTITTNLDINVLDSSLDVPKTGFFTDVIDGGEVVPVATLVAIGFGVMALIVFVIRRARRKPGSQSKLHSPLREKFSKIVRISAIMLTIGGIAVVSMLPREADAADGGRLITLSLAEQPGAISAVRGEELTKVAELRVSVDTASLNDAELTVTSGAMRDGIEISAGGSIRLPAGTTDAVVPVSIKVSDEVAAGRYTEPIELTANIKEGFWRASGRDVINRYGMVERLKGFNMNTAGAPWYDTDLPNPGRFMVPHTEFAYAELEELGVNVIRLNFPARMLADSCTTPACLTYDYVEEYFSLFDQALEIASRHGVGIIFNVHDSFGTSQPRGGSTNSFKWNTFLPENIEKTTELWRRIATRFKDEKRVLGFDLVNEPAIRIESNQSATDATMRWDAVAQGMINAVRTIDENHMIVVERAMAGLKNGGTLVSLGDDYVLPNVSDPAKNLMLEFHTYSPNNYTHQQDDRIQNDPWVWGDPNAIGLAAGSLSATSVVWPPATFTAGTDPKGEWVTIANSSAPKGVPVADPQYNLATFSVHATGTQAGTTVYLDEIKVDQYSADDVFEKTVREITFRHSTEFGTNSPASTVVETDASLCYDDEGGCMKIFGPPVAGSGNILLSRQSDDNRLFRIDPTKKYLVTAKVYDENLPAGAKVMIDFGYIHAGDNQVMPYGKDYLYARHKKFIDYSKEKNIPVFNGEWGILKNGAVWDRIGGGQYAKDFLDLYRENNIHSAYFPYMRTATSPTDSTYGLRTREFEGWGSEMFAPVNAENTALNTVLYDTFLGDKE